MRSPWLSREYEKSGNVIVKKVSGNYKLRSKNTNASLMLSEEEYKKYENNLFNEIEWERLFFRGLAVDKNCKDIVIDNFFDIESKKFVKSKNVEKFQLKVGDEIFKILI